MDNNSQQKAAAGNSSTAAYYFSILLLGTFTALGGPALPTLAENTSSTLDQISLYFVLGSLGYLVGSFFGGQAYDRFPGNRLLSLTLVVVGTSGALIPVAGSLWWLLTVQFTLGLAQGANDVGCNTLLLWAHGSEAGPYINGLHFSFGVGTFIAPLALAGILSQAGKVQWAFWIFSVLCLILAAWIWKLPEGDYAENQSSAQNHSTALFPAAFLALAFLFYVGAEVGFGDWIYTYALSRGMATAVSSAYLTSVFWGTFTAGRLLGVWVSTRLGPVPVLLGDLLGCLASLSLIAIWPASIPALWIGSIGSGLFMASVFPTMLVLAGERLQISGRVTSWFLVGGGAGSMILPWVIGQMFAGVGSGVMPLFILAAVLLNLAFVLLFSFKTSPLPG